ncbi:hypothetical protein [Spirosoma flavum]|uniref:Uncharacterized protein n=1 Tax=Spirosoma flavum TaxID=2048557 RepID=A0ABW6ASI9_9BACT
MVSEQGRSFASPNLGSEDRIATRATLLSQRRLPAGNRRAALRSNRLGTGQDKLKVARHSPPCPKLPDRCLLRSKR